VDTYCALPWDRFISFFNQIFIEYWLIHFQDVSSVLRRNVDGELEKTSIHFEVFKWLSAKLGFKYIIYPFGTDTFVNTSVQVGAATYLLTGVNWL
jgi:hypothetical protein